MNPVVDRSSLEIRLADELTGLSADDAALCRALLFAIRCVQKPKWFGPLPKSIREDVRRWSRHADRAHFAGTASIDRQVAIGEAVYGLKRTRSGSSKKAEKPGPTAFDFAARRLGISPNTVANKARRPVTRERRRK